MVFKWDATGGWFGDWLNWRQLESHSFVTNSLEYQPMDGASAPRSPSEGQSVRKQVQRVCTLPGGPPGQERTREREREEREMERWVLDRISRKTVRVHGRKVLGRQEFKEREEDTEG